MVESRDWVVPMVQGKPRLNKPPLIYWMQSASVAAFTGGNVARDAIWMYRVPSYLAAIVMVVLTWAWGKRMFDARAAWLAGVLVACCPVMWWEGRQARADMVLVACTVAALWMMWEVWRAGRHQMPTGGTQSTHRRRGWLVPLVFWVAIGAGVLVKGPATPLICALAAVALTVMDRRAAWLLRLRPLFGVVLLTLVCAPWIIAVGQRVGWSEYANLVYNETIGRSLEPKEGHGGWPLYHTTMVLVAFWPACLLLGVAWWRACRLGLWHSGWRLVWRWRLARGAEGFLICAFVPGWVAFEVISTKLPHYTMPLYPLLALMCARALWWAMSDARARAFVASIWVKAGMCVWAFGGVVVWVVGVALAAWGIEERAGTNIGTVLSVLVIAVLLVPLCLFLWRIGQAIRIGYLPAVLRLGLCMFVVASSLIGVSLGNVPIWTSRHLASLITELDPDGNAPIACCGYEEDSLIFETRGRAVRITETELASWAAANPNGLIVLSGGRSLDRPEWPVAAHASGYNYSKGRWVAPVVIRAADAAPRGGGQP